MKTSKQTKHPLSDLPSFDDAMVPVAGGQSQPDYHHAGTNGDALRLIGAVSHEMRNPLNGILGMAHLLGETKLDAAQTSYLDGIRSSGDMLLALVNDLLDLTALQSGAMALHVEPTNIVQMVEQCVELAAPRAHAKGLSVGSTFDPILAPPGSALPDQTPFEMHIDGSRLRQILTNLLSNAIKFTDQGGVQTAVSLDAPTQLLVFDVIDTGAGIAPADQSMVFEPFGRTKTALVSGTEGTGLGLPLSRQLAQAMGGALRVEQSTLGHGTTMRLTLPLGDTPFPLASDDQPLAGQTVMLALRSALANSPETQALAATLAAMGAQTRIASDPSALNAAPSDFDHVLVDGDFDHAMLWARLCLSGQGLRPITLLRPGDRARLDDLKDAGFSGYLIRPVRQSSLVSMLTHRFEDDTQSSFLPDPIDAADTIANTLAPKRILLADDNPVNALLAQTTLEKAGHEVVVVGDGARAIALACQNNEDGKPFDTILLDLSMPVLDGFAAARQLRRGGFAGRLIAFSGNTDPNLQARLQAAGFDSFAQKPLPPQALQALVQED